MVEHYLTFIIKVMESLKEFIAKHKVNKEKADDFVIYLSNLIKERGYSKDSQVYNKANISRQTWSSIMSGKHIPSLNNLIKIVFALELNNHECKYLLKKAGYTLSSANNYYLIIRYCIENKIYDLSKLNDLLIENGYEDSLIA